MCPRRRRRAIDLAYAGADDTFTVLNRTRTISMRFACCTMLGAVIACAPSPPIDVALPAADASAARVEVAEMFRAAARAWNRGDLDAFMSDYVPNATYVGGRGLLRGTESIRAAYAPRFAPGAARDSLSFEGLEVDLLAPGVAHAVAFYVLARGDSVTARGPTSLVLRKVNGRWLIVHDHSS